jgi:hypothetical protein
MSRNLGALTSWNPVGLFRPVMGQLYLYLATIADFTVATYSPISVSFHQVFNYLYTWTVA